ncbi:MAG: hypothetical protein Phyf2KO_13260 [Phycisphaerales bacterium]
MHRLRALKSTVAGIATVAGLLLSAASADGQTGQAQQASQTQVANVASEWINPERRKLDKYELGNKNLAIEGYDPVAYFPEGGSKPKKGKKAHEHTHRGVVYRFVSAENLRKFKNNPDKYEPTHGGWCAYAIAKGDYTEPNPKRFVIQNDRLMLFYDGLFGDTYKSWHKEGPEQLEKKADQFWLNATGERARVPGEAEQAENDNG